MNAEKLVDSFEEYLEMGGRLNEDSFGMAGILVNEAKSSQRIVDYGPSFSQVKNMAKRCDLKITNEQINTYIFLREDKDLGGMDGGLCDQEIFAETLLLTGDIISREQFIKQNQHIFNS
jgi:hypothetical protein